MELRESTPLPYTDEDESEKLAIPLCEINLIYLSLYAFGMHSNDIWGMWKKEDLVFLVGVATSLTQPEQWGINPVL